MRAYKTEINPTPEQKQIIHQTIGVCRYVYNFYLAYNKEIYKTEKRLFLIIKNIFGLSKLEVKQ
jgi:putative transposase